MRKPLHRLPTLALALMATFPLQAQKARTASSRKTTPKTEVTDAQSAQQLISTYRFERAAAQLQREIAAAQRAGHSTAMLEADLQRANLGQDMLRGTEKVMFVDSFQVARANALSAIRLSQEAGRLVSLADLKGDISSTATDFGTTAFINELGDRVVFSATDSVGKGKALWMAYRNGTTWSGAAPMEGLDDDTADRDFPFMMADGSTLYFAAQGEESLGGYDIYVTRYDAATHRYLKPENVGMPFNSPANDYLMGVDETTGLGFFVTDRRQPVDSVCVYVFVPNASREVYELTAANEREVIEAAEISSIAQTQTDPDALRAARKRMASARQTAETGAKARLYVINDTKVYSSLQQFRSEAARRIAEQADAVADELESALAQYDRLQQEAAQAGSHRTQQLNASLAELSQRIPQLRTSLQQLHVNMRKAEVK